jgi:hypothetical protein
MVRASALLVAFAAAASGCNPSSPSAADRLSRLSAQGAELERAVDEMEERLLGNQARVHLWQELARRHEHVSALACENLSAHAMAMAKRLDVQQEKRRARRGKQQARPEAMSAAQVNTVRARSN